MGFQASCSQPFSNSHRERFLTSQGEERVIPEREDGEGDGPSPGLSIFLPFYSTALPSSSCPQPPHPGEVMLSSPPELGVGWGRMSALLEASGSHPPLCPPTHTYKLENQYLLELEGSITLLLEMEAHSPERPHQCAWQLQRLHQCGGVAQSLGSQAWEAMGLGSDPGSSASQICDLTSFFNLSGRWLPCCKMVYHESKMNLVFLGY